MVFCQWGKWIALNTNTRLVLPTASAFVWHSQCWCKNTLNRLMWLLFLPAKGGRDITRLCRGRIHTIFDLNLNVNGGNVTHIPQFYCSLFCFLTERPQCCVSKLFPSKTHMGKIAIQKILKLTQILGKVIYIKQNLPTNHSNRSSFLTLYNSYRTF